MSNSRLFLKPRGAAAPVPWEEIAVDAPEVGPLTPMDEAQFVALDVETTGNSPFLVLELGAERFTLDQTLSFFDTLVDCRAPINPYARRRHQIDRSMLIGAPVFKDARRAFLRFAQGAGPGRGPDAAEAKRVSCKSGSGCSSPDRPTPISRTGRASRCDFSSAERAARKIASTSSVGLVRLTWRLTSLKSGSFSFT